VGYNKPCLSRIELTLAPPNINN